MAYYDALRVYWATLPQPAAGDIVTISTNLQSINTHTIPGLSVDVHVSKVAGYLMRTGKLIGLEAYAKSPPDKSDPVAVGGAMMLSAICSNQSPLTIFEMSDPTVAAQLEKMLSAIVADPNTGLDEKDQAAIIGLSRGVPLIWHNTPIAAGGAGLTGDYVNGWDLYSAGLISAADANSVEVLHQS